MAPDQISSQVPWNPLSGPGRPQAMRRLPMGPPAGPGPGKPALATTAAVARAPLAGPAQAVHHRAAAAARWLASSTPRARIAAVAIALAAAMLGFELPRSAGAAPSYPVPYTILAGAAAELASPGASPPGANDWTCRPSAAHPEPVVLVHGLLANMTDNWATISPLLADNGYCVFALNYGADPGVGAPLDQIGGLQPMEHSAQDLSGFIDRVLAATGARKVDIVGHSEGATMPYYYLKMLGGAAKVARYVGLAPVYHGTTLDGLSMLASLLAAGAPGAAALVGQYCGSCQEFLPGSAFLAAMDATAPAVSGVLFTDIVTRMDEVVSPYTSGFLTGPNVTNIVVQDQCPLDLADHVALAADPVAAQDVLNALDPVHAVAPPCTAVLPFIG
ncbi:MAG TPA: alpha/beta fold hydrolase [Actinomycetota bacterium]|nr:alpha/beta fold hydrolase [Actinomycetota bacterium]